MNVREVSQSLDQFFRNRRSREVKTRRTIRLPRLKHFANPTCSQKEGKTPEPFLDWVKIAFFDFYSIRNEQDLLTFQSTLARQTNEIVKLYRASFQDQSLQRISANFAFAPAAELDTKSIWFHKTKLRAYIDVSLQVRILQILVDHLTAQTFWPSLTSLQIAEMIVKYQSTSRAAILCAGWTAAGGRRSAICCSFRKRRPCAVRFLPDRTKSVVSRICSSESIRRTNGPQ